MYAAPAKPAAPLAHVVRLITNPKREWAIIAPEPGTVASLYTGYVMPLALIAALCPAIGVALFGITVPIMNVHLKLGVVYAVVFFVIEFIRVNLQVYLGALFLNALANQFQTTKSPFQATKVAAYSMTPILLMSVFGLFPPLALLSLIGAAYGVYLMYLGIRAALLTPPSKAVLYLALTVVLTIVATGIVGAIMNLALKPFTPAITPDMLPDWMRPKPR